MIKSYRQIPLSIEPLNICGYINSKRALFIISSIYPLCTEKTPLSFLFVHDEVSKSWINVCLAHIFYINNVFLQQNTFKIVHIKSNMQRIEIELSKINNFKPS